MVAKQQPPTDALYEISSELKSPRAKLVYLYLSQGEASVDALQDALDLKKIDLYSILQTLAGRGLVERTASDTFRCC